MRMKDVKLIENNDWDAIHEEFGGLGGVYKLISKKDDGTVQTVSHTVRNDSDGILYIGQAGRFTARVDDLRKTIDTMYNGSFHKAGIRYNENMNLINQYPRESLYVRLIPSDHSEELESELIEKYVKKYGEHPPLNTN